MLSTLTLQIAEDSSSYENHDFLNCKIHLSLILHVEMLDTWNLQ